MDEPVVQRVNLRYSLSMSEKGAIARCANSKASYTALSIFRTAFEKAIVVREEKKNLPTQHIRREYTSPIMQTCSYHFSLQHN